MGRMISFSRPDGGSTSGWLAEAGNDRPGVIVLQEWWGLNDQICGIADRFARHGYNALAPDLYQGRVTGDADEAGHMMDGLDFPGATHQDTCGAARHLKSLSNGRVAVTGFCMGGALTIAAAVHVAECDVAVAFYGIPPKEFADASAIRIPFQGHFANTDDWCTPEAVDSLVGDLNAGNVAHELYRYDAEHAFFNEVSDAYDVASARTSWARMMEFLSARL